MDEVGEVGEAAKNCEQAPGEETVDGAAVALHTGQHDPTKAEGPCYPREPSIEGGLKPCVVDCAGSHGVADCHQKEAD